MQTQYITADYRCEILQKRRGLEEKLIELRKDRNRTCSHEITTQGNETNGDHHAHEQEEQVLMQQIRRIEDVLSSTTVAQEPTNCKHVRIGLVVTVARTDTNRRGSEEHTWHIVGYEEGDPTSEPQKVSHTTPIAELLLGAKRGETRAGMIGNVEKSYKVLWIERPGKQVSEPLLRSV